MLPGAKLCPASTPWNDELRVAHRCVAKTRLLLPISAFCFLDRSEWPVLALGHLLPAARQFLDQLAARGPTVLRDWVEGPGNDGPFAGSEHAQIGLRPNIIRLKVTRAVGKGKPA